MAIKKYFLFVLLVNLFFLKFAAAQATIIPDLSDSYINRLIDTAKKNYPRVKTYQNRINIANNNISKTKLGLLSAVTVSYIYQPGTTTIDPTNPATSYFKGFQAGVFLNVGTILSQPYLTRQAKQELLIANNDQDEYFLTLATEVKKRYYVYIQRLAELKLQTKAEQDMESSLKDIKYKFEKGEETFDNYTKTQVQVTDRQASKIAAESGLFSAKADLEELLGTQLENIK
jgi:outer membrane protein TolC